MYVEPQEELQNEELCMPKYGFPCTAVCRECREKSCSNSQISDLSDDVEIVDDDDV